MQLSTPAILTYSAAMGNRLLSAVLFARILLCCSPVLSFAQTASHAFSLEQVMSSPFPTNLVASQPTADHAGRIAWVFAAKGERNVWVAEAPNFAGRQVTHYS